MFQSELLVVRRSGNKIRPRFIGKEGIDAVREVIGIFTSCVGLKKGVLDERFGEYEEESAVDHRFLRGLYVLLERMITPEKPLTTTEDPYVIRQAVYAEANRLFGGSIILDEEKTKVLNSASKELKMPVDDLLASIWADEDEEQIVERFEPPPPKALLSQYNLSLIQTLLFKATVLEVTFRASTNKLRDILRMIRFFGLMYDARRRDDLISLTLNGPVSTLKLTKKYGTSLAKTIPYIMETRGWSLRANILDRSYSKKPRILEFRLSGDEFSKYFFVESGLGAVDEDRFDSLVEYEFFHQFDSLRTGWSIIREPEPLILESTVMFPDFSFERGGCVVYMEVVGFWTEDYLKNKLKKIQKLPPGIKFILCINRSLRCSLRSHKDMDVIYYKKTIPVKKVYDILKRYGEIIIKRELNKIDEKKIVESLTSPVVRLDELSSKLCVSADSLRKFLESNVIRGYSHTKNILLSDSKIDEISSEIGGLHADEMKYGSVLLILKKYGVPDESCPEVLNKLGYRVEWKTLDIEDSVVVTV